MFFKIWMEQFSWANIVTLMRLFIFSPLLIYGIIVNNLWLIIFSLLAGSGTDILDGWLARSLNQTSNFGKIIDPLADKVFLIGCVLTLVHKFALDLAPFIPTILAELILVILGTIPLFFKKLRIKLGANIFGKIKFTIQCFGGMLLIVNLYFVPFPIILVYSIFWLSFIFALFSILGHIRSITK